MEVKGMIARAPGDGALGAAVGRLIRLALNARIHNVIATNGTVIDDYIPGPESNAIPFLDIETFAIHAVAVPIAAAVVLSVSTSTAIPLALVVVFLAVAAAIAIAAGCGCAGRWPLVMVGAHFRCLSV